MDDMLHIMIPAEDIDEADYHIGDYVRIAMTEFEIFISPDEDGDLYQIDKYDLANDMFQASRVLH